MCVADLVFLGKKSDISNLNFSYLGSVIYVASFDVVGPAGMKESGLGAVCLVLCVLLSWNFKEIKVFWAWLALVYFLSVSVLLLTRALCFMFRLSEVGIILSWLWLGWS